MDSKELEEKMQIIFNMERDRLNYGYPEYGYQYIGPGRKTRPPSTGLISENSESYNLDFPTLDSLKKLYIQIENNEKMKKSFLKFLLNHASKKGVPSNATGFADVSVLSFATLIKLGFINMAIDALIGKSDRYDISRPLRFIFSFIHYEYPVLTPDNMKSIIRLNDLAINTTNIGYRNSVIIINNIRKQINKIRYDNLLKELEGINFQINQDRLKVIEKIRLFGFDESLAKFLDKAEAYYWDTSKDEFDWASGIGILREFSNVLVENVAENIRKKIKEGYPKERKTLIGNMRLYTKKHLDMKELDKLFDALMDIINSKGSHKLISDREYYRLTKNMLIEIALIIFTKLEKFLSK